MHKVKSQSPLTPVYEHIQGRIDLWSWLCRSQVRSEIYCPPALHVSEEEFARAIQDQVITNRLPADAGLRSVYWRDNGTKQSCCVIVPTESELDFSCYVCGMDVVGAFTYIEERIVTRPPYYPLGHKPGVTLKDIELRKSHAEQWKKRIADYAVQAQTNDRLTRYNAAVNSTVRQVIQTLFLDREAELRERKEQERSQKELEEELARRRTEGF